EDRSQRVVRRRGLRSGRRREGSLDRAQGRGILHDSGPPPGGYALPLTARPGPSAGLRSAMDTERGIYAAKVCGIAAVYYGAAKLGLSLAFATPSVTAVWPPTGIALASLVIWGHRFWPGVALGAFVANLWTGV